MSEQATIGQFEQLVLTAVLALADNAYGVTIHEHVSVLAAPKRVSLGAVYATLDRLEDKGLVTSWLSDPTPERGGRSKRHYRLQRRRGAGVARVGADGQTRLRPHRSGLGSERMESEPPVETRPPALIESAVGLLVPPRRARARARRSRGALLVAGAVSRRRRPDGPVRRRQPDPAHHRTSPCGRWSRCCWQPASTRVRRSRGFRARFRRWPC